MEQQNLQSGTGAMICLGGFGIAKNLNAGGIIFSSNIEISSPSFSCIDMKTTSGNSDYDVRIGCNNSSSGASG